MINFDGNHLKLFGTREKLPKESVCLSARPSVRPSAKTATWVKIDTKQVTQDESELNGRKPGGLSLLENVLVVVLQPTKSPTHFWPQLSYTQ